MLKRAALGLVFLLMALVLRASACMVPPQIFADNYIAAANEFAHTTDGVNFNNGGNVSLPFSLYVKVVKIGPRVGLNPIPIDHIQLQYKVKHVGDNWGNVWTDCKEIDNPDWSINFENGPVALFGKNVLDIPNLDQNSEVMIRVYMSADSGLYQNADLNEDTDENGNDPATGNPTTWSPPYVVKVTYDGKHKPKDVKP